MNFDINILYDVSLIDLTRSYIYVLELVDSRYYIGRTCNFIQRMEEHFTGDGSIYTKKYKPLKIVEVVEEKTKYDERDKTLEYMEMYGWKKVRGYAWCSIELTKKPEIKKNSIKSNEEYNYTNYNNEVRVLYENENMDIIKIGSILNKSPGSIAYILEKMKIIDRRQLARGYMDYVFSDLYKISKKERDVIRLQKEEERKLKVKNILNNNDSKLTKEELLDIKEKIRMYFSLK